MLTQTKDKFSIQTSNGKPPNSPKTLDEVNDMAKNLYTDHDPKVILEKAGPLLDELKEGKNRGGKTVTTDVLFKAMTLSELENGALMTTVINEEYKTFAIYLMRKLQEEFDCLTAGEKSIAELASLNFIRVIEIQGRINNFISQDGKTEAGLKYLSILSKELDRANRHFLTAIQTLRMLKQPSWNVNIKSDTTFVGQNQFIKEERNVNAI